MKTKIETVRVAHDTDVWGAVLPAGRYCVEMPVDYDVARVTAEDILLDCQIRIVGGALEAQVR